MTATIGPARTAKEIFDWLVAEHGATHVSYSSVRDYVAGLGRRTMRPRPRRILAPALPDSPGPPSGTIPAMTSPAHLAVECGDLPRPHDLLDVGRDVEGDICLRV